MKTVAVQMVTQVCHANVVLTDTSVCQMVVVDLNAVSDVTAMDMLSHVTLILDDAWLE